MHRWDEGSFPFRYQEAFCSYQQESQNQDGMDEESFQELAADYKRLMGRETKKKKKKRRRRSGYAYEAKMNEGTKMFVGCNSIRAKHGKIQEALVEARLTSEEFRLCSHHCTHWYQGKDVQLGESKPCCC